MDVVEAIRNRRSIRQFRPDPIPRKVLEAVLETCRWAPSSNNTQPWHLAVVGGKMLEKLKTALSERVQAEWDKSLLKYRDIHPDIPYADLREPYRQRATDCRNHIDSWQFPAGTEDLAGKRATHLLRGARFYDAPSIIIVYTERYLLPKSILDIGIMAQTINMAAFARGLGTCLQAMPLNWPEITRGVLGIPEDKALGLIVSIGYPDTTARINSVERTREPLDSFTQWYGF